MFGSPTILLLNVLLQVVLLIGSWWWLYRRAPIRQSQINALNDATRLGEMPTTLAQRLLIIRAIDDEASLTLALGTIVNYTTRRFIVLSFLVFVIVSNSLYLPRFGFFAQLADHSWALILTPVLTIIALLMTLFGMLMVSRSVHGRELAVSPIECQINTQSAPDAVDLSKIVTLVSRTYAKSRRHGIYDHEDCAKTISDWVHSQLCPLPVR